MSWRFCTRFLLLTAMAVVLQLSHATADDGHVFIVIVPQPLPQPPPQAPSSVQPPLQWAPPLARGATPGVRSPTALCYVGTYVCPLQNPDRPGEPCSCDATGAARLGRALIPPSHDISGRPLQTH